MADGATTLYKVWLEGMQTSDTELGSHVMKKTMIATSKPIVFPLIHRLIDKLKWSSAIFPATAAREVGYTRGG